MGRLHSTRVNEGGEGGKKHARHDDMILRVTQVLEVLPRL